MRVEAAEYISIQIDNPWVLKPTHQTPPHQKAVYFKKREYRVKIVPKIEENKNEKYETAGKATRASILILALIMLTSVACSRKFWSVVIFFIRFFNIMTILSNLSKINIPLSPGLQKAIIFIENLQFPVTEQLASLSPFSKNQGGDEPDSFLLVSRGSRGKLTQQNREVFGARGQNLFLALLIIFLWIFNWFGYKMILICCGIPKRKVLGYSLVVYHSVVGVMFFRYHMWCVTEIAVFDYGRLYRRFREIPSRFVVSLGFCYILVFLMMKELLEAYLALRKARVGLDSPSEGGVGAGSKRRKNLPSSMIVPKEMSISEELLLEKYCLGLDFDRNGPGHLLGWMEMLRFFGIQVVTASLQTIEKAQGVTVLTLNILYFAYFIKKISPSRDLHKSKVYLLKAVLQECCLLLVLIILVIFSFFEENQRLSSSLTFTLIERVGIVTILLVVLAEFITLGMAITSWFGSICARKKGKQTSKKRKRAQRYTKRDLREAPNARERAPVSQNHPGAGDSNRARLSKRKRRSNVDQKPRRLRERLEESMKKKRGIRSDSDPEGDH